MRDHAEVAIIGGGVTGCSIAYHLAKAGVRDVVLLERSELTAGSTWHAAGGIGAFGGGANQTFLHKYSFEIYERLEEETGQSCGLHKNGALRLARTDARVEELTRERALLKRHGLSGEWLSAEEAAAKAPVLDTSTVKAVLFEAEGGYVDPSGVTHAFAKGARDNGAEIVRHCPVLETNLRADGGWDLVTPQGTIRAEKVVNAAGLWAREVAALAGITLPLMPVEHHYFVTETIPEIEALDFELPNIGDADAEYYSRQEGLGMLLGVYEDTCTHWSVDGTPLDFGHELLPDDLGRIERSLAQAVESIPVLGRAGIKRVINGPMIFSPDLGPLLGPHPGLPSYWCACGVMTAFSQAAGIGMALTEWMVNGEPPFDIFMWDVTRFGGWADAAYTKARTGDMYSTRFKTIYPYEQSAIGRPVKTTPAFDVYKARGAYFGSSDGLEIPLWFGAEGAEPRETLTFRRPNWFETVAEECRALTNGVGIIDITGYGKHTVTGPGAAAWLDRVMAGRVPTEDGRVVLTPMLSRNGHLKGEFSICRLTPEEFVLIGSGTADRFHHRWWEHTLTDDVEVRSQTDVWCGYSVSGPNARDLLQRLTNEDLSGEAMPYQRGRRIDLGPATGALLLRVAYTGELGYEIFFDPAEQVPLLEALMEAGADLGARLVGSRALNSLRIEKGYGAWGVEFTLDYTPFEAGMGRLVRFEKPDFIGREAALALRDQPRRYSYTKFEIDAEDCDPWGGEPILCGDEVAGYFSSAAFGFRTGKSLGVGYLLGSHVDATDLSVDLLGTIRAVRVLEKAAFDPTGARMRS